MTLRLASALALVAAVCCGQNPPGYPRRDANLDVRPGFQNPPPGYGEVSFYWWLGDPLTRERLTWQLDQLKDKGISALQVNYAHSDQGGRSYGLTIASEPPLFSPGWWDLFGWFLKQARQRGMAASLSDYTLGWAGNGWYMDEILKDHPDMHGAVLERTAYNCSADCTWAAPANSLSLTAFRVENGRLLPNTGIDLLGKSKWIPPHGAWRIIAVNRKEVPISIDPMHPLSGAQMIEKFFQRFEDRNPGESGKGLNFFFSDELSFGVRGWLWNSAFRDEFRKRKGYDVTPELASLFEDTGPRAVKVRLDYSDVMVALSEENYFRPLYEWHHSRGMLYGCDHGGRGRDVTEFGDYFRTQRWMTGPGNDQPGLASDVIKNKVASSITHLYERERTWLEGYYGSGWGTTSADIVDATWRNFAQGQNLLTLHGLYYSTRGGWWEWAPPCNHFHMPYWAHMGEFLHTVERMSYLLSQGRHRADVAIVYPVAAMEAGLNGKEAVQTAFDFGKTLYSHGIDFDFIDFQSLERARVEDRMLKVAGEQYRALVIPAMRAVRHSTLEKADELHRGGGVAIVLGAPPEASERIGAGDPGVIALARELPRLRNHEEALGRINTAFPRDFACNAAAQPSVLHRIAGTRDIYMVYGAAKNTECTFRTTGKVELWDPWSGASRELPIVLQSGGMTTLRMPLESTEAQLIVFQPGSPAIGASPEPTPTAIRIDGLWDFELVPTLDNRFGDYRLPATNTLLGAEARRLRYADDAPGVTKDSTGPETTYSYGPRFWKLGPLPDSVDTAALENRLAGVESIDPAVPVEIAGKVYRWHSYDFSWRFGIENDPGHQGYHGLKGNVPEDLIGLGKLEMKPTTTAYTAETEGSRYYLWTSVPSPRAMDARLSSGGDLQPSALWVGGKRLAPDAARAGLRTGSNSLLLRYDRPGRGYVVLLDPETPQHWTQDAPGASRWFNRPGILPFDTRPGDPHPAGWYWTVSPPGLQSMSFITRGTAALWFDGKLIDLPPPLVRADGANEYHAVLGTPANRPMRVAIRVAQERGAYAGAAFVEPIAFHCGKGELETGDWSRISGLSSYSGGAWYRKNIDLTAEQAAGSIEIDLGNVSASAEVLVNGKRAGIRLAPPYRVNISQLVHVGENRLEVLVYSALSNHYQTIPTRYLRPGPSGLLGPVNLLISSSGRPIIQRHLAQQQ